MSLAELERAMRIAGIEAPARWEETTGSTNALALELAAAGAPAWTVVGAGHQTEGRGRHGRRWDDAGAEPGAGPRALLVSVLLRPTLDPEDLGLISLLSGTAMAGAAAAVAGVQLRCKWPNDLLLGDGKVGGILGEPVWSAAGHVEHIALGIGVNLRAPAGVPGAAGIGEQVNRAELLGSFLGRLRRGYEAIDTDPAWAAEAIDAWTALSATLGREVIAERTDGGRVQGIATALDPHGGLVVASATGPVVVASGQVHHLRPPEVAGP
jgi:BirA family biotin operon repressor/biotin-[acetyl-CoA-carboxylase] ligase